MSCMVDDPLLHNGLTACVTVGETRVGMAADYMPLFHRSASRGLPPIIDPLQPLVEHVVRVDGGHSCIAVPVERDQWNGLRQLLDMLGCPLFHRREPRGEIVRSPVGESRMHAYGGIEVGIGCSHDGSHGTSRRHPRDVDPVSIDVIRAHDLPRDPGDERWFALATMLVSWLEPVPTPRVIGRLRLL